MQACGFHGHVRRVVVVTAHLMVDDWTQATGGKPIGVRFFECTCGFRGFDWAAHVALRAQFDLLGPDISTEVSS